MQGRARGRLLAFGLWVAAAAAAERGPGKWQKPWATHAGCAELVRRFDFNANMSGVAYQRFASCVMKRGELPDWNGERRPPLLSGEHYPVSVVPSKRGPPSFWVTPAWDYVVSNFIRREGTFQPEELSLYRALAQPGGVVCDVGAHVGSYAVPLASHLGLSGSVHAFEPFRLVYQLLAANVAVNGLANVHAHQVALGAEPAHLRLQSPSLTRSSNIGATRVFGQVEPHLTPEHVLQYEGEETVRVVTLDSFELPHVDFIKVDVEGALDRFLRGAADTIQRQRPIIAAEHSGEEAPPLLVEWGYRCAMVLPVHEVWVCVPRDRWWRYRWLEHARAALAGEPAPVASSEGGIEPKAASLERRREVPPPSLDAGWA